MNVDSPFNNGTKFLHPSSRAAEEFDRVDVGFEFSFDWLKSGMSCFGQSEKS